MNKTSFIYSFRARLLLVLLFLLVATLGTQYYLNLRAESENAARRERQEKAIVAGITLGFISMSSEDRLNKIIRNENQPFSRERLERIADILIIDDEWQINDSLNSAYVPREGENGQMRYVKLQDLTALPPLLDDEILGADRAQFPNTRDKPTHSNDGEAHAIPVETAQYGRWYVMVVLHSDKGDAQVKAAQPLVYTLAVLLIAIVVAVFLVWRFTRPIAALSEAAQRVAEGDFRRGRVSGERRRDEMGRLAVRFNEMVEKLGHTRELETKLQQAEKSAVVGRLGSAIAHEIRNPLNYINLTLDHLRAKFAPAENGKRETFDRLTGQLKTEVERINNQITGFLSYSRPSRLNLQPTDLREIVEDSLRLIEPQAEEHNVVTSIIEREALPPITGDGKALRSVFSNLFLNAVQAMFDSEGGRVTATVSVCEPGFVCVTVADTGRGIEPENLDKIFEPYFSTKETGTGLGLAIVKKIVDDHNGIIKVESKSNKGTVFTVMLPSAA